MAVIVITGASSGIGEATAKHLAQSGHSLVLAARRADRLERLAAALPSTAAVAVVPVDVADPKAIERLAKLAVERFGRIDVWINNAGVGHSLDWWEDSPEQLRRVIDVNLTAPVLATRAVLPFMRQQGSGHIINVASVAGHVGTAGVYSATKFGVRGYSEALRREVAPFGIRVSVVSPGYIRTEMTEGNGQRMPGPEIVAEAIAKLIERPRREMIVPGWYRPLTWLAWFAPWLADTVLIRARRKRQGGPSN